MSPLQSSGEISLGDLGTFFSDSQPHSLSEFYKGGSLVSSSISGGSVPTSGTISLSNFYGVDNAPAAPAAAGVGLSDAFFDTTGNGTDASWSTYTPDVSSFAGCRVRLVWYIRTVSTNRFWASDFAIDDVIVDGVTTNFQNHPTGWQRTDTPDCGPYGFNDIGVQPYRFVTYNRNISNERWSARNNATGSNETGPTAGASGGDDYYLYYEGTGGSGPNDGWMRSPIYTLASSNPSISFKRSMRGDGVTNFKFYLDVIEDANGNTNSNFHLPNEGIDYKNPLVEIVGSSSPTTGAGPWTTYTPDISRYANKSVKFVWVVQVSYWRGDVQMDDFTVSGLNGSSDYTWDGGAATDWKTTTTSARPGYGISNTATPIYHTAVKRWNIRAGSTPSRDTGQSVDGSGSSTGKYMYYEASGTTFDSWAYLSSPSFNLGSSPSVSFKMAAYGSQIRSCKVFVDIL